MYTVIEMQDGIVNGNLWTFETENEAYAKYHSVLAVASVSTVPCHSCVILRQDGLLIAGMCYKHEVVEQESK